MEQVIYHYTTLEYFVKIIESGVLKVSDFERSNKVKPAACWLSLNPIWENTASKAIKNNETGETATLAFEEQHEILGCARFVLPFKKHELCTWAKYKYASNTPIKLFENMTTFGFQKGSNPTDWYASFNSIPLTDVLAFEIWDGSDWVNHNDDLEDAITLQYERLNAVTFNA